MTIMFLAAGCGGNTPPPSATAMQTSTSQLSITPTAGLTEDECAEVARIPPDAPAVQAIGQAILTAVTEQASPLDRQHAPFEFAEIWSIDRAGDRIVVQASFNRVFEPGIFIVRATPAGFEYVGLGWGGKANSADEIRVEIARTAPDILPALVECLDLSRWFS